MIFGYPWWMTYGHLAVAAPAGLAAAWLFRRRKAKAMKWILVVVAAWAAAAFLVAKLGFRLDAPLSPPTARFLASGSGKVLDMGCGSGRATIGLLRARPRATAVGLDDWSADYIRGNDPELLLANARAAGVDSRLSARSADMRELPFEDGAFDAVMSAYAVDHLDGPGIMRALSEAVRVLKPGGDLLLLNMVKDGWTKFAYTPLLGLHASGSSRASHGGGGHGSASSGSSWRGLLEHLGLEVIEIGRRPGTLYFLARKPGPRV